MVRWIELFAYIETYYNTADTPRFDTSARRNSKPGIFP
ncbi:MAG: hypothetical protein JWM59_3624 [Verrucomicrobiales bacterium]|nr:hypothetical protein [Verrucomicrobiales bacterium]